MKINPKDIKIGHYLYWTNPYDDKHNIAARIVDVVNILTIYAIVIQESHWNMNRAGREVLFKAKQCEFYSCIEDINKILIFK